MRQASCVWAVQTEVYMGPQPRIECSVWTNGSNGWGVRVLGGNNVREKYFQKTISPVIVEVDGVDREFNINKKSFWTNACGELIGKAIRGWKDRHKLESGERVWLEVLEPYRRFRLSIK